MKPTETALIVPVPAAEEAVGPYRASLDGHHQAVSAHLPIRAAVPSVRVISGSPEPGSWRTVTEFPLGDGRSHPG